MGSVLKAGEVKLTCVRRRISVLFCDLRGFFYDLGEFAAREGGQLLNDYFE